MRGLWTVLRRGIAARSARTVATGLAVAAAVAFLSGTLIFTRSINAAVQRSAGQAAQGTTVVITSASGLGASVLTGSPTLPGDLVTRVRQVPGVSTAVGIMSGFAMALNGTGHSASSGAALGISLPASPSLRPLALRHGRWPASADQVVVDAATAGTLSLTPGSRLRVTLVTGVRTFTVSGIAGYGSADTVAGLSIIGFTPAAAADLLGTGGKYSAIEAAASPATTALELAARIRTAVGPGYTVSTAAQQARHVASSVGNVASLIGTVAGAFAVIALIVAALLIANTFTITVAQRTQELALLRCIGASRSQTARLVLGEAALTGLSGGLVGLVAGLGLATGLHAVLTSTGLYLPAAAPELQAGTVLAALTVGIGVSVAAAGGAAVRAARSRPLAALAADEYTGPRKTGRARRAGGAIAMLMGAFLLAVSAQTAQVAFGALLLLTGFGLAGPVLVRPLTAPARALLSLASGFCGQLAGRQMIRNPRRVAGAAGTLGVAVATIAIVATLAATFTSSAAQNVRRSLLASYVISTSSGTRAGLDPSLARRISRLPGVIQAAGLPCGTFSSPGGSETVCGISPASLPGLVNLGITAGRLSALRADAIAVSARVAARLNWHVGQPISVDYPLGGTRTERIAALYDYDEAAGSFLIPLPDYRRLFPPSEQANQLILVKATRGAGQQVRGELATLLTSYPQATLDDQAGYSRQVSSGINLIATMMTGLLALSLLIGLIAVTTALALSVLERTREIGLLRAIGAAARQIRLIVRAEALATIVTGAITGLILGMVIGWPLARAIDVYIVGGPGIPVPLLAVTVPAAIAVSYLAAIVPARRAAHLPILTALHIE